jgi:hypothetical protein
MMKMDQYVIAVKRERWGEVRLSDVLKRVTAIRGYNVLGDTSGVRTLIEASDEALMQIQSKLRDCCYIEPVILHSRQ